MSAFAIAAVVFACASVAALLGLLVGRALPETHLQPDSRDIVKQGMTLVATLAALVLALMVARGRDIHDGQKKAVRELAEDVLLLNRTLALYGSGTSEQRELLRRSAAATLNRIWPEDNEAGDLAPGEAMTVYEAFYMAVGRLKPQDETQNLLKAQILELVARQDQTRFRLFIQKDHPIPWFFLVVLTFWLMVLFAGWGLLARAIQRWSPS